MPHHILIVDDERDLEQLIKQKFRKQVANNEIVFSAAYNGLQALKVLQEQEEIVLVLTDINMPEMDGLTLLKAIRELNKPSLKAIVISAYGDMENIRAAMNLGAFDFITKPINFTDLEITINKTIDEINEIKQAMESHNQLIAVQHELNIAHHIQQSILPQSSPTFCNRKEFDLAALITPAREVGGDFYDFFMIDENHLGFCIGDVAGKGVPAAIFMALCKTAIKFIASKSASPGECFQMVNKTLVQDSPLDIFVTAFYGILNIQTGELNYCNAGHNPTYKIDLQGEVQCLPPVDGIPLGFLKDFQYGTQKVTLQKGETLFLYTDGVDEAMDKNENEFSEMRLRNTLQKVNQTDLDQLNQFVLNEVQQFTGGIPQSDDITLLSLRYRQE